MRPVSADSHGPAPPPPPEILSRPPNLPAGPLLPTSEMSLLQALGPVQSWLGQELEKCGIDAMIYTRYVLSLLLHDSYDYDLQDQENDIFLGWEKGAGKKWSRSKKRGGTDLMSLEEMKKQAAVQCLRSASDENSGIESLVEELCSKLKDLQNKQKEEKQIRKKSEGSQSPERAESPSSKDQVEMYYEAFPPLSEKPVCLQEIMTVWNKAKASYSSSSSSAAPQTSTDTSSPKDCTSDGDTTAAKDRSLEAASGGGINATAASSNNNERAPPPAVQRRSKKEKENRYHGATTTTAGGELQDRSTVYSKRQTRHRSEGKYRPRSWSSGSSEEGSSSSGGGNQGDSKSFKAVRIRHKSREAAAATRGKRVRSSAGQVKLALKVIDRDERRNTGGSSSSTAGTGPAPAAARHSQLYKKGKRPLKEIRSKDPGWGGEQAKEPGGVGVDEAKQEYMEEPLWYTEPITEYFVPFSSRSKLETTYRSKVDSPDDGGDDLSLSADLERLPERIQGICIANDSYQRTYLAAGSFVDGHFVEGLVDDVEEEEEEEDEADLTGTSSCCPQPEDGKDLDDEHLSEFTHFYEVDIYQSILDTSASDAIQESRILSMIRQKSDVEQRDLEAECCLVLDGLQLQQPGESAIRADSRQEEEAPGSDGFLMQDLENMAQVWGCYSPSSSEDIDGESFAGDSPVRLSPLLDSVSFTLSRLSGTLEEEEPQRVPGGEAPPGDPPGGLSSSCFSLFELQYESPTFPFLRDSLTVGQENNNNNTTDSSSCLDPHSNKQSRLLIWTKNSAFDETEHCSNLSTRTCSPWSHSEETRSDNEQGSAQIEDPSLIIGNEEINCIIPPLSGTYLEEEILEFLQEDAGGPCEEVKVQTLTKKSKLESICGIALEEDESMPVYDTGMFSDNANQPSEEYSSGIIKDIWTAIGDDGGNPGETSQPGGGAEKQPSEGLFSSEEASGVGYHCGCLEVHAPKGAPAALQGGPLQQTKAVQRSEYHLWESKKEEQGLPVAKNKLSSSSSSSSSKPVDAVGAGDYMTPSKVPWDTNADKDGTSFILGGVYGELKTLSGDKNWAVTVPPGGKQDSLLQCAAAAAASAAATGTGTCGTAADMVTITGTDLFMNAAGTGCFAPGHRALWRPLVSFGQSDHHHQAIKGGSSAAAADALNKGFSFIFHEDLLGGFHRHHGGDERGSGLDYPFSSFSLNNPFSQVLHVECSFEPEDMASFSPGFKPKSILCSDSESEAATTAAAFHPRLYGINRTQYRAIRISPRTHFRPISASELSPGGGSDSEEAESEKEEAAAAAVRLPPAPAPPADVFDDPQADLKPLEEDAECEGPYYGKSELESGKFLPRLKKSGMEKSAQTSLDSQEGSTSATLLLPIAEQEICLDCEMAAAAAAAASSSSSTSAGGVVAGRTDAPAVSEIQREESPGEKENCSPGAPPSGPVPIPKYGIACDFVADVAEFPLNLSGQGGASDQQDESWWQNTLCSPLFPGSQCTGRSNI